jgi:hypothetical protein
MTGRTLEMDGLHFYVNGFQSGTRALNVRYSFASTLTKYVTLHGLHYFSEAGNIVLAFNEWLTRNEKTNNTLLNQVEWGRLRDDFLLAIRRHNHLYDAEENNLSQLKTRDGIPYIPSYSDEESWEKIKHDGSQWRHSFYYTESEQIAIEEKRVRYKQNCYHDSSDSDSDSENSSTPVIIPVVTFS